LGVHNIFKPRFVGDSVFNHGQCRISPSSRELNVLSSLYFVLFAFLVWTLLVCPWLGVEVCAIGCGLCLGCGCSAFGLGCPFGTLRGMGSLAWVGWRWWFPPPWLSLCQRSCRSRCWSCTWWDLLRASRRVSTVLPLTLRLRSRSSSFGVTDLALTWPGTL